MMEFGLFTKIELKTKFKERPILAQAVQSPGFNIASEGIHDAYIDARGDPHFKARWLFPGFSAVGKTTLVSEDWEIFTNRLNESWQEIVRGLSSRVTPPAPRLLSFSTSDILEIGRKIGTIGKETPQGEITRDEYNATSEVPERMRGLEEMYLQDYPIVTIEDMVLITYRRNAEGIAQGADRGGYDDLRARIRNGHHIYCTPVRASAKDRDKNMRIREQAGELLRSGDPEGAKNLLVRQGIIDDRVDDPESFFQGYTHTGNRKTLEQQEKDVAELIYMMQNEGMVHEPFLPRYANLGLKDFVRRVVANRNYFSQLEGDFYNLWLSELYGDAFRRRTGVIDNYRVTRRKKKGVFGKVLSQNRLVNVLAEEAKRCEFRKPGLLAEVKDLGLLP